ncbi:MAG: hypothetical protein WBP26_02855 [Candidatus Saccharimonadales bacterium]
MYYQESMRERAMIGAALYIPSPPEPFTTDLLGQAGYHVIDVSGFLDTQHQRLGTDEPMQGWMRRMCERRGRAWQEILLLEQVGPAIYEFAAPTGLPDVALVGLTSSFDHHRLQRNLPALSEPVHRLLFLAS